MLRQRASSKKVFFGGTKKHPARMLVKGFAALNFGVPKQALDDHLSRQSPLPHRVTLGVLRIAILDIGESRGVNWGHVR